MSAVYQPLIKDKLTIDQPLAAYQSQIVNDFAHIKQAEVIYPNRSYPAPYTMLAGNRVTVAGYLTSIRGIVVGDFAAQEIRFHLMRPMGGENYQVIWSSPSISTPTAGNKTYNPPIPVPVQVGDAFAVVALYGDGAKGTSYAATVNANIPVQGAGVCSVYAGAVAQGQTYTFSGGTDAYFFPVEATVSNRVAQNTLILNGQNELPENVVRLSDAPWKGKRILWLGTSIPAGGDPSYPAQVGDKLLATVINNAIGSSGVVYDGGRVLSLSGTAAELNALQPITGSYYSYENLMLGKTPDLVVFDHGYNDRIYTIGALANSGWNRATFIGAMEYLIDKLYIENPAVRLAFITPPTRYALTGQEAMNNAIRTAILAVAEKYCSPVLDLMNTAGFNDRTEATLTLDDIHPNAVGNSRIARMCYDWIKGF